MKLIKKIDRESAQVRKFPFGGESKSVSEPPVPDWIQAAGQVRMLQESKADPAALEKAAFDRGFHQGEKAALEIAEKKMEVAMKRYADSVIEVGRLKPALYAQAERNIVRLALEVAKKIVHREVQVDREIVQTLIRVALSHVSEKAGVTIRLHPADYNFMLERRNALVQPGEGEMTLVADPAVDRGGCLIETESGNVDARIAEEFREVERAFLSGGE